MHHPTAQARATLYLLKEFQGDLALTVLRATASRFRKAVEEVQLQSSHNPTNAEFVSAQAMLAEVDRLERTVQYSLAIQHATGDHFATWQAVSHATQHQPSTVIRALVWAKEFSLARRWAKAHQVDESEIDLNYLALLMQDQAFYTGQQILEQLPLKDAYKLSLELVQQAVAPEESSTRTGLGLSNVQGIRFLTQFLLENCKDLNTDLVVDQLTRLRAGIDMVLALPENMQTALKPLLSSPPRIIEDLLMHSLASHAQTCLNLFANQPREQVAFLELDGQDRLTPLDRGEQPELRSRASSVASRRSQNPQTKTLPLPLPPVMGLPTSASSNSLTVEPRADINLVAFYARRALLFETGGSSIHSNDGFINVSSAATPSGYVCLAQVALAQQVAARNEFRYDDTPNCSLCLSLLELDPNRLHAAELCVELSRELSMRLSTHPEESDVLMVINSIKQLLLQAKVYYVEQGAMAEAEGCETARAHADLLHDLAMHPDGRQFLGRSLLSTLSRFVMICHDLVMLFGGSQCRWASWLRRTRAAGFETGSRMPISLSWRWR